MWKFKGLWFQDSLHKTRFQCQCLLDNNISIRRQLLPISRWALIYVSCGYENGMYYVITSTSFLHNEISKKLFIWPQSFRLGTNYFIGRKLCSWIWNFEKQAGLKIWEPSTKEHLLLSKISSCLGAFCFSSFSVHRQQAEKADPKNHESVRKIGDMKKQRR